MLKNVKKTIYIILMLFTALFIFSSFFVRAKYNYFIYGDRPILTKQEPGIFSILIFIILPMGFLFYKISLKLDRYDKSLILPISILISFLLQTGFIFEFPRLPTDDSKTVYTLALNMFYHKDYSSFGEGGYLHMFPFNYGTVLYIMALLKLFPDSYVVIKSFNILFSLVITLMIYKINGLLDCKSAHKDYGILFFAATYIPGIFMSNFIYNDVMATAFFTCSVYFLIKFVRKRAVKDMLASAFFLSIGNYFRNIGLIFLIAAIIYVVLNMNVLKAGLAAASVFILILAVNIPGLAQNYYLQKANIISGSVKENSAPVHMWLNMGMNFEKLGFWDDFKSYNIYRIDASYKKQLSIKLFKEDIREKISNSTVGGLLSHYYRKLIWTWTEGTYQIERYGFGNDMDTSAKKCPRHGGYEYRTFATNLFKDDSMYRSAMNWILYVINFLMYLFILFGLIQRVKAGKFEGLLLVLIILGVIAFYIIWEIKSRYIYPVYPILIILSFQGFKRAYDIAFTTVTKRR